MSRLVVVSNRVAPIRRTRTGSEGGLAVAILSALKEMGGIWFGWSGETVAREVGEPNVFRTGNITFATVDLSATDFDDYYNGFANRVLWPLFHYRLDLTDFSRRRLRGYERVNSLFARNLHALLEPDDIVWVHDYHLIPLGEKLRELGCRQRTGFFLHIPWPVSEVLVALPNHQALVRALAAYDLVGFQTDRDLRAFQGYVRDEAGGKVSDNGWIEAFGRRFRAAAFPISIDTEAVAQQAKDSASSQPVARLKASVGQCQIVIGVDRLDYSKGLPQRFNAFMELLRDYPANRGHVVLLQIAPTSRGEVPEYQDMREELEAVAGHINGTYADYDWAPIRYLNKGFKQSVLAGFHRISRVGLVTPLRDGMNLVAKEYVAAQAPEDPGVLVLSRFAGAARELDSALIVNPYDTEGVAAALQRALTMPLEERRERWRAMFQRLRQQDIHAWRESFIETLRAAKPAA